MAPSGASMSWSLLMIGITDEPIEEIEFAWFTIVEFERERELVS